MAIGTERQTKHSFFVRPAIEVRQYASLGLQVRVLGLGLLVGLVIATLILMASGIGLFDLANEFVVSIFTNPTSLAAVLTQTAPLMIAGLAATVAFRARFWNIGIEGQMIAGAILATGVAIFDIGPPSTRIWLMMLAAAIGGMAWIVLPTFLRLRLGVNEIISTLLLNYVAFNLLLHLLYGPWKDPKSGFPNSAEFDLVERIPLIGWQTLSYSLLLALLLAGLCWWLFNVSRFGFYAAFVHANAKMAAAMGLSVVGIVGAGALLSGALAGMTGFVISAGVEYRMTQGFFLGYGFSGILIAFLGRNSPLGAALVSVFVAILFVAGQSLQVFYQIPGSMVQLIQAVIVITVASAEFFVRYRLRWPR